MALDERFIQFFSSPKGIRTPVASVKGRCPWPLDDGGLNVNTVNIVLHLYLFVNGLVLT